MIKIIGLLLLFLLALSIRLEFYRWYALSYSDGCMDAAYQLKKETGDPFLFDFCKSIEYFNNKAVKESWF